MAHERTTAAFGKVLIAGSIYDLSHLDSFNFEFVVSEKGGRPRQLYAIEVMFSWHCFTRGIAAGEDFAKVLAYSRGRETRLFDERRYHLSKKLPGIIRSIGSRKCFHTGRGNFLTVELLDEEGNRIEYAIFFKVSRRAEPRGLTLRVESAYIRGGQVPFGRPRPPRPIRFSVIAYNTATGKPINEPK